MIDLSSSGQIGIITIKRTAIITIILIKFIKLCPLCSRRMACGGEEPPRVWRGADY